MKRLNPIIIVIVLALVFAATSAGITAENKDKNYIINQSGIYRFQVDSIPENKLKSEGNHQVREIKQTGQYEEPGTINYKPGRKPLELKPKNESSAFNRTLADGPAFGPENFWLKINGGSWQRMDQDIEFQAGDDFEIRLDESAWEKVPPGKYRGKLELIPSGAGNGATLNVEAEVAPLGTAEISADDIAWTIDDPTEENQESEPAAWTIDINTNQNVNIEFDSRGGDLKEFNDRFKYKISDTDDRLTSNNPKYFKPGANKNFEIGHLGEYSGKLSLKYSSSDNWQDLKADSYNDTITITVSQ